MDISLKKDKRNLGNQFHKMPRGTGNPEAKAQAMKDITEDSESINYVARENEVMRLSLIPKFTILIAM